MYFGIIFFTQALGNLHWNIKYSDVYDIFFFLCQMDMDEPGKIP